MQGLYLIGLVALQEEEKDFSFPSMHMCQGKARWGCGEKAAVCKTEREFSPEFEPCQTFILDFQPPELWENKFLSFKPPSLWYLLWQPKPANTLSIILGHIRDTEYLFYGWMHFVDVINIYIWISRIRLRYYQQIFYRKK